ncbi:hypothetical protein BDV06DRAFT_114333 [Aspergillus oleicola]
MCNHKESIVQHLDACRWGIVGRRARQHRFLPCFWNSVMFCATATARPHYDHGGMEREVGFVSRAVKWLCLGLGAAGLLLAFSTGELSISESRVVPESRSSHLKITSCSWGLKAGKGCSV